MAVLRTPFVHRWSGAVAVLGFGAVGLAGVLTAFSTDLPDEAMTWHGLAHGIGLLLLLLGTAVTFIASGLALRGAPGWKGYWVYSLLNYPLAIAVAVALSAFRPGVLLRPGRVAARLVRRRDGHAAATTHRRGVLTSPSGPRPSGRTTR